VIRQWRQLKHVKAFILRQWLARFQLAALDLPMNKNLDSLKLTPLIVQALFQSAARRFSVS
jgi:hypothetical protein